MSKYPDWPGHLNGSWLAHKSAKRNHNPRELTRESFISRVAKDLDESRKQWLIDPTDPASSHSPYLSQKTVWVVDSGPASELWQGDMNVITLCINVSGPLSELMEYLEWRIRHEKSHRNLKDQKHILKHHFDEYSKYLRVFDLRRDGKNRKEIAEIVLSGNTGDLQKRISEYLSRAKLLITRVQRGIW